MVFHAEKTAKTAETKSMATEQNRQQEAAETAETERLAAEQNLAETESSEEMHLFYLGVHVIYTTHIM